MIRIIKLILLTGLILIPVVGYGRLDQPHHPQGTSSVNCGNCHWTAGGTPPWSGQTKPTGWSDADWTINNQRCWVCHNTNSSKPASIHSASTTSTQYWSGQWTTECVSCHNPHNQRQWVAWRTDPDLYLATGAFTVTGVGTYDSVNNRTPITLSSPLTDEYQDRYFMPDKNYPFFYKIISSTLNQNIFYVRGKVNTTYVRGNGFAIIYGMSIKDYISYTNPGGQKITASIKLFRPGLNVQGGFIDSNNYSTSLCQACHTQTANFTQSNPNHGTTITEGQSCLNPASGCHAEHPQGFQIAGAKCGVCHGVPPSYYNSPADHNLVKKIKIDGTEYDTNTGVTTPGAHVKHSQTSAMTYSRRQVGCMECHNAGMQPAESDPTIGDYKIQIGINATTVGYTGGNYDGRTSLANGFTYQAVSPTTVTTNNTLVCSNIYCHGSTIGGTVNPSWTGTVSCGDCHKATAAAPPTLGSHVKHAGNTSTMQSAITCSTCHGHSGTASAVHVDGSAQWNLNTGDPRIGSQATYRGLNSGSVNPVPSSTYGQCSNLYCHSNASPLGGTASYKTVTWGGAAMACNSCHSGAGDASPTWSVSHTKHVNTYTQYNCNHCHSTVASNNTTISDKTLHVNATKEISFNSFNPSALPYDSANHQCSNLYCHSNASPLGGTNVYVTATWNTSLDCGGCHKKADTTANMTAGGTIGLMSSAHVIHVALDQYGDPSRSAKQITCQSCHNTVASGNSTIINYANHVNAIKNVGFDTSWIGGSPSYSGSPNYQCSSVYCHSDGQPLGQGSPVYKTVAWNAGALTCNDCHASNPNTNAHLKHTNASTYNMGCVECHQSVVSNNTTISSKVLHVNKIKDVAWKTGGYNADGGPYSSPNCSNIYCHSQGTENSAPYSSPNVTAAWNTTLTCKGCHDFNAAATPDIMSTGAHAKHVNNASVMGVNFTCSECHNQTVSSGDSPVTNFALHVNKQVNIAFNTTLNPGASYAGSPAPMQKAPGSAYGQCTNLYCHSSGNIARSATPTYKTPSWSDTFTDHCDQCHGDGAGRSHPVYASGTPGSNTANSHIQHVENASIGCEVCHYTTTTDGINIVSGGGQHLNKQEDVSFTATIGGTYNADTSCSSTYCHGTSSPQWGATGVLNCGSCHQSMGAGGTASYNGAHLKHSGIASGEYNFSCEQCHSANGTVHAGGPVNASKQAAEIVFTNGTGTGAYRGSQQTNYKYYTMYTNPYTGTGVTPSAYVSGTTVQSDSVNPALKWTSEGTCNNIWCHSNAAPYGGTNTYVSVQWGATVNCGSCHAAIGNSAPHPKHVTTYPYTCNHCHSATASDNTTISSKAEHVDGQKDIVFNTWVGPSPTWNAGAHQCSNTYCHSAGTSFTSPTHAGLLWSGTMSCTSCHGNPPSYASGSPKANSHVEHVNNNGASCYNCHAATVNSGGAISNYANHVNKAYEVVGGGTFAGNPVSFSYTYGNPSTCSNISCHGGTGATWGAATPCQDCHMLNQSDVDDFTWLNGTKAVISQTEWLSTGHGRTTGTYPVSGNTAANFEAASPQQCFYCHDNAVLHGTSNYFRLRNINDPQWGMNGVCKDCHATGSTGITVNGVLRNSTKKIDSRHYGTKHSTSNNGGQFCWDCHDPHGDSNIYMIHASVAKTSSSTDGKPTTTAVTVFTNNNTGTDYAKSTAPYNGICNVCHTSTNHYTSSSGDGHNSGTRCTSCHPHTGPDYNSAFSPSGGESAGGLACRDCHIDLYNRMHDSTLSGGKLMVYKHYMNNDSATSYPTSATPGGSADTNRKCLMCHVDHDIFRPDLNPNATRSKNLRTSISITPTTSSGFSESDFDATTGGICLSCHVNQQTKAFTTPNNVSTVPPVPYSGLTLAQATQVVKNSTHNYAVTSGAFGDTSTFKAVCLKCHNDTMNPKSSMNGQKAEPKFGLHQSGRNSFFAVMGSGNFKDFVSGQITAVSGTTITVNQDLTKDYKGFALVVTKANGTQAQRAIITATDTSLEQVTVASWPSFTPSVNDFFEITKDITPIEEVCFNCHSQGANSGGTGLDKPNNYKLTDGMDFYNAEPMQNRLEQLFNLFNADSGRLKADAGRNATSVTVCTNNTVTANEFVNYFFRSGSQVKKVSANTATNADTTCSTNYGLANSYTLTISALSAALSAGTSYNVAKPAAHPLDNLGLHKPDEHLTATAGWNLGDSGSCTAVTTNTCTDSTKRWVGSFAGKTITFTSGACAGQTFTISSNTANTITLSPTPSCTLSVGDTYYIGSRHVSCSDCHNTHAAQVNPSGKVSSVSNTPPSAIFIKDTDKTYDKTGWQSDKWKGYLIMIRKSSGFRQIRQITSSVTDATGTTYYVGLIWNTTNPPAAGDEYEVFKQDGSAGSGQKGVWGVSVGHQPPNTTNTNDNYRRGADYTYTKVWDAQYERDLCMKCHSYYGFLSAPPTTPSLFGTVNTIMPASDIAEEANPDNLAHHAIFARGKNQPITATGSTTATGRPYGANPNWPKYTTGTISITTAGTATLGGGGSLPQNVLPGWMVYVGTTNYPTAGSANTPRNWFEIIEIYSSTSFKVTPAPSAALTNQTYAITAGLGNTFVPPYGPWSILKCKDCHGSTLSDPLGPHASVNKFLVRSIEPIIGYEFFNGSSVVINTEIQNSGTAYNNNYFCFNCHRRTVYGDQGLLNPGNDNYARVRHGNADLGGLYRTDSRVADPTWVGTGIHCNQCHAGYRGTGTAGSERVGGIHGTNFYSKNAQGTSRAAWTTKQGKRFLNGASWAIGSGDGNASGGVARPTTTTSGGCYVRKTADSMNRCTQGHSGDRAYGGATYDYDNP